MIDFYRFRHFTKYKNLLHAVTTKDPDRAYSFSMALHTGEDQKKIIQNRAGVLALFNNDKEIHFIVANQTHSDHVKVIKKLESKGWFSLSDAIEDYDALVTDRQNLVITVLTADCVPILLYDPEKKIIAAVHAGWKGTKAGIVAKTVKKMCEEFGSDPGDIVSGVAPSIGRCCYEVGKDVAEHFFDLPEAYTQKGEKYMLDLPYINKYQLLEAGLSEANIEMSGICTACETERFFSYRKEQGCSGRFMSMIGMTSESRAI